MNTLNKIYEMREDKLTSVIWKYKLEVKDLQEISVPRGSVILSVQTQNNVPCLWVLVNHPDMEKVNVKIRTIGTGINFNREISRPSGFLGTYQLNNGAFVGHVFQLDLF